jgi:hypothetical protein
MSQEQFYVGWINNRYTVINDKINELFGEDFFKNKSILELGALYGHFGNKFYQKGANLTCFEGRAENLEVLKKFYPHFNAKLFDCDKESITEHYDVILHIGLLYHLKNVEKSLVNSLENCDVLILETENIDNNSEEIHITYEGISKDCYVSSLPNSDCENLVTRTSRNFLEKIFKENNFSYHLISDGRANTHPYTYNWVSNNTGSTSALRSIYIAHRNK